MNGEGGSAGAPGEGEGRTGEEEGVLIHLDRTEEELAAEFAAKDKPLRMNLCWNPRPTSKQPPPSHPLSSLPT